jgi:F0F1-type ATP synthase membrane subunit a
LSDLGFDFLGFGFSPFMSLSFSKNPFAIIFYLLSSFSFCLSASFRLYGMA